MTDSFPAGGNLAMQIINNGTDDQTISVNIDYLEEISNYTVLLLNNDYDLAANHSLVVVDGTDVKATIPAKSLIVFSMDAVWT